MIIKCVTDNDVVIPGESLSGITFEDLDLHRALLEEKNLSGSKFIKVNLRGAFLYSADFSNCILQSCNFIVADLRKASFKNTQFDNCTLWSGNFESADLENVFFQNTTSLEGVSFKDTNLKGANFQYCTELDKASFENAIYDSETKWPDTFNPEKHGCIKV